MDNCNITWLLLLQGMSRYYVWLWKTYSEDPVSKLKPEASKAYVCEMAETCPGLSDAQSMSVDQQHSPDWELVRNGVLELQHPWIRICILITSPVYVCTLTRSPGNSVRETLPVGERGERHGGACSRLQATYFIGGDSWANIKELAPWRPGSERGYSWVSKSVYHKVHILSIIVNKLIKLSKNVRYKSPLFAGSFTTLWDVVYNHGDWSFLASSALLKSAYYIIQGQSLPEIPYIILPAIKSIAYASLL